MKKISLLGMLTIISTTSFSHPIAREAKTAAMLARKQDCTQNFESIERKRLEEQNDILRTSLADCFMQQQDVQEKYQQLQQDRSNERWEIAGCTITSIGVLGFFAYLVSLAK